MDLNSFCCIVKCGASEVGSPSFHCWHPVRIAPHIHDCLAQALVKSGCCLSGEVKITDGGATCQLPCCQMVQLLDLSLMTLKVESPHLTHHPGGYQDPNDPNDICVYTNENIVVESLSADDPTGKAKH